MGEEGLILLPPDPVLVPAAALALASQLHSCLLVLPLDHLVVLPVLQVCGQFRVLSLLSPLPGRVTLLVCLHERGPGLHDVVADGALAQGRGLVQTGLSIFLHSIKDLCGGMVQQVANHLLAARADSMVQKRAAPLVTVQEVTPGSVQLLELGAGGRAGLGLLWATLLPATEALPNSHGPQGP